tara:strand:+ start:300 stop:635 length:336 start_codon:yes stop_codon:yes gene_type:complete
VEGIGHKGIFAPASPAIATRPALSIRRAQGRGRFAVGADAAGVNPRRFAQDVLIKFWAADSNCEVFRYRQPFPFQVVKVPFDGLAFLSREPMRNRRRKSAHAIDQKHVLKP